MRALPSLALSRERMAASPLLAVDVEMVRGASATHTLRLIWGWIGGLAFRERER